MNFNALVEPRVKALHAHSLSQFSDNMVLGRQTRNTNFVSFIFTSQNFIILVAKFYSDLVSSIGLVRK